MFIGAGLIGFIAFLVLWLVFGHFWIGVIAGLIIAAIGGGIYFGGGGRGRTYRT